MQSYDLLPLIIIAITAVVSYIGFNNQAFFSQYMFNVGLIRQRKEYYRLITSGFLHANGWHLFFNLFTLYFFGRLIVALYGERIFILLYFGAIISGNLFSLWLNQRYYTYTAIGASGGVSGILFAAIALAPLQQIYVYFIPITSWIFATLYFAYSVWRLLNPRPHDNVGHEAHLGGAVLGMLVTAIMAPSIMLHNIVYIGIMSLPLIYLAFELFFNKNVRKK